jgi:hypothetical protein
MLPDLPNLLAYNNSHVLNRYLLDYPNNQRNAAEVFQELMKFFWLTLKHEADKSRFPDDETLNFICGIHVEMKEMDDMWHTFLLFTQDYMWFCKKYFGKYLHHAPTLHGERLDKIKFARDLSQFLSYVYDNLGEQTLLKWFGELIVEPG